MIRNLFGLLCVFLWFGLLIFLNQDKSYIEAHINKLQYDAISQFENQQTIMSNLIYTKQFNPINKVKHINIKEEKNNQTSISFKEEFHNTDFDKLLQKYNINIQNKSKKLTDEEVENKKNIIKQVIWFFLLNVKDTSTFNNLTITIKNMYPNNKVRGKFNVHTKEKIEIELNENLDSIMIISTLTHEIGHQLTYLIPKEEYKVFYDTNCYPNKYAQKNIREAIAETFTYWLNAELPSDICKERIGNVFLTSFFQDAFKLYYIKTNNNKEESYLNYFNEYYEQQTTKDKTITTLKSKYLFWLDWMYISSINALFDISNF